MDFNKIKPAIKKQGFTFRKVCADVGITEAGLHQMIRNKSMQVDVLEKIAKSINLNVGYFFDEPTLDVGGKKVDDKDDKYAMLDELLKARDSEIEVLKKLVAMYEGSEGRGSQKAC